MRNRRDVDDVAFVNRLYFASTASTIKYNGYRKMMKKHFGL